jgi:TIR domain
MSDIFISYNSSDRLKAQALGSRLEEEGWSVWWDRKIPPGQSFSQVLEEALNSAKCVVVLWSKTSVASDWVQNEAAEGKRRGILVPAFIEDTAPPFEFRRIQAANLVDWDKETSGNELPQFLEAVRNILNGEGSVGKQISGRGEPAGAKKHPERSLAPKSSVRQKRALSWRSSGRWILLTLFVGAALISLFKTLYPHTPITEALTTIIIISIIGGISLNYGWKRWQQKRADKP